MKQALGTVVVEGQQVKIHAALICRSHTNFESIWRIRDYMHNLPLLWGEAKLANKSVQKIHDTNWIMTVLPYVNAIIHCTYICKHFQGQRHEIYNPRDARMLKFEKMTQTERYLK